MLITLFITFYNFFPLNLFFLKSCIYKNHLLIIS
nr:MAG TPA: hypothetical protein [Microviridae sp.]